MIKNPSFMHFLSFFAMFILSAFVWKTLAYGVVAKRSPDTAAAMTALV